MLSLLKSISVRAVFKPTECDLDIQTELFQYTDHPGVGFPNKDIGFPRATGIILGQCGMTIE